MERSVTEGRREATRWVPTGVFTKVRSRIARTGGGESDLQTWLPERESPEETAEPQDTDVSLHAWLAGSPEVDLERSGDRQPSTGEGPDPKSSRAAGRARDERAAPGRSDPVPRAVRAEIARTRATARADLERGMEDLRREVAAELSELHEMLGAANSAIKAELGGRIGMACDDLAADLASTREEITDMNRRFQELSSSLGARTSRSELALRSRTASEIDRRLSDVEAQIEARVGSVEKRAEAGLKSTDAGVRRHLEGAEAELARRLAATEKEIEDRLKAAERRLKARERTTREQTEREVAAGVRAAERTAQAIVEEHAEANSATARPAKRRKRQRSRGTRRSAAPAAGIPLSEVTFEQLRELGLSVTQAARLIAFRDVNGMTDPGDLGDVRGLPKSTIAKLKQALVAG